MKEKKILLKIIIILEGFNLDKLPDININDIHIDIIFELDENSILTVTGVIKENNYEKSIIIRNVKGGLSREEIELAKIKNKREKKELKELKKQMSLDKNYKNEIDKLLNDINHSTNVLQKHFLIENLKIKLENYIEFLDKNVFDNFAFNENLKKYLTYLFKLYSLLLKDNKYQSEREKKKYYI